MKIDILGIHVDKTGIQELRGYCFELLTNTEQRPPHQIVTVNPEFVMEAQRNNEFRDVLNNAGLALADGIGLVFASWFLRGWKNRLSRITGVDFTLMLAELCGKTGKSIYLLGAGSGVAKKAADILIQKYPTLRIAGAEEGIQKIIVDHVFNEQICKRIVNAGADVLLVAFGAPKQDLWIAQNSWRLEGVRIAVGVGGTFDYLAGVVSYAPAWIRGIGLEWLYRLMKQSHRFWRIYTAVIRFPFAVFREKLGIRRFEHQVKSCSALPENKESSSTRGSSSGLMDNDDRE